MSKTRKRGHPAVFTTAQNRELHRALLSLKADEELTDTELARVLGVVQQTASRLVGVGQFSYAPATALAQRLGFTGVDAFFVERGVAHVARAS